VAWQPDLPGLRESCLDTLVAAMTTKIADLETALTISPALSLGASITSGQFHVGDPDTLPDLSTSPFWVSVVGGGKRDGTDTEIEVKQSGPGFWLTVHTNIYLYLHPDAFPSTDAFSQATQRERFRARFTDWLRADVFNTPAAYSLTLGSKETTNGGPAYDELNESYIRDISMGYVLKSFGPSVWVFMAHYAHSGKIYGG